MIYVLGAITVYYFFAILEAQDNINMLASEIDNLRNELKTTKGFTSEEYSNSLDDIRFDV